MTGRVLAVGGAKGGVGTTTTAINLTAGLAESGRRTVLVEADLSTANVADYLDPEEEVSFTLHEVLADSAPVAAASYPAPGEFRVIPSGTTLEGYTKADPYELEAVVDTLRTRYDDVILDTPSGVGRETLLPLAVADTTLVVASTCPAAARDADKTLTALDRLDRTALGTAVIESGRSDGPSPDAVADFLDLDLLGTIPRDDAVPIAQTNGEPVLSYSPASPAAGAFDRLAGRVRTALDTHDTTETGASIDRGEAALTDGGR